MWCLLAAAVLYPLIESGWSARGPIPDHLLNPAQPVMISDVRLQEQADLYRRISDPSVRTQIALSLRDANNPAALNRIMELLMKEKTVSSQENLLITLRMIADQTECAVPCPEQLLPFLNSDSAMVRQEASRLMIRAGTGLPEIEAMLKQNTSPEVTENVLSCLADAAIRISPETVFQLAASPVQAIQNSAIRYLAQTSENPDNEKILSEAVVRSSKSELTKLALVRGLAANKGKRCPKMLIKLISPENCSVAIRVEAASMPGTTPDRSDFLENLLDDPSASVRAFAADSLRFAKHSRALEKALGRHLNDENASVRENAAKTLSRMVGNELSENVLNMVSDRRALAPLLIVIRSTGNRKYAPAAAEIMKFAKKEKDSRLLSLSIETLAAIRAESMTPLILDCAADPSAGVRTAVAKCLSGFPGSATTVVLKKLAGDSAEVVAVAAMESMRVQANPEFVPVLSDAIGKFKKSVLFRATACAAFSGMPGKLDAAGLKNLEKLILTKCIDVPMSLPVYDDPLPRAMGLLLLLKSAQAGNTASRELFTKAINRLQKPAEQEKNDGICSGFMAEYLRQVLLLHAGKSVEPEKMPVNTPEFRTEKIHIR